MTFKDSFLTSAIQNINKFDNNKDKRESKILIRDTQYRRISCNASHSTFNKLLQVANWTPEIVIPGTLPLLLIKLMQNCFLFYFSLWLCKCAPQPASSQSKTITKDTIKMVHLLICTFKLVNIWVH